MSNEQAVASASTAGGTAIPGAGNDIARQITELVAAIVEKDADEIWEVRDKHLFEELALDSLLALEIIAAVEKQYKIEIPEERLEDIVTLSRTIALTTALIEQQGAGQAS